MALNCLGVIPRVSCDDIAPCRVLPDRSVSPIAIVIHLLSGIGPEAYNDFLASPCTNFKCPPNTLGCSDPQGTLNPKSVHFLVTQTGAIQYAELTRVTLGIDYLLNPTWPGISEIDPAQLNERLIHVAISATDLLSSSLITLLCCIGIELGLDLPIIAASDLQADRPPLIINPSIPATVSNCILSGGVTPTPSIDTVIDDIEQLQQCCTDNTSAIIVLQGSVTDLNSRVSSLETRTTLLETKVEDIQTTIAVIPALVEQVTTLINQVNDILTRCCPQPPVNKCIRYQLLPGDEMLITPNQPVWLNLPTKIEDVAVADGGPLVMPGPLWQAKLCECAWRINALVRFRLASWCAGRKASLYLVACGKKYLIAEQVIASTGTQAVTLTGEFLLPGNPCCSDVHLLVATNDDNTTSAKVVEFAEISACCA